MGWRRYTGIKIVSVGAVLLALVVWSGQHLSYDVWGSFFVFPVLLLLTIPLARRVARQDQDPRMFRLIMWAFVLKEASALARYFVAFSVYGGNADAARYHFAGSNLAPLYRHGFVNAPIGGRVLGTNFISIVTGWVYVFTGPTKFGGFLVFSWFGFLGLYLCYRAFRIALPNGERRRYAHLLFFLPSLLFWPSSIGKESWMMLCLGICALGIARLLAHAGRGGFPILLVGTVGLSVVRPHVTLLLLGGLIFAFLLQPSRQKTLASRAGKLTGVVLLVAAFLVVINTSNSFFNEQSFNPSNVISRTAQQTNQGGSAFKASSASKNPAVLPLAIVTVLFRPFPFEAHNGQGVLASLEGTTLLIIFVRSRKRIKAAFKQSYRQGYVAFCAMYSLLFIVAFSSIGNFGIVSRERVQLYPFVLVLICLPAASDGIAAAGRKARQSEARWRLVPAPSNR